uniref:N-alpha-acetyltransferase 60 n=1 Tax=Ditylenchus dipsaci TaxID=166011 RepID=A0A915D747_9BILA
MAPTTIPSCCLTPQQKEVLINAVKNRPFIWDCSSQYYTEVGMRRSGFSQIADLLSDDNTQYTGAEMQVEWKKLKDVFNRTLKSWRYWESMQFMVDNEKLHSHKMRKKNRSRTEETNIQVAQKAVHEIDNTSTNEYCSLGNNQDVMVDQKLMNLEWLASQIPLSNSSQEDIEHKDDTFSVTSNQLEVIKQTTSAEVFKRSQLVHRSSTDSCTDFTCANTTEPAHTSINANLPATKRKRSFFEQQRADGYLSTRCRSNKPSGPQKTLQNSHKMTDNTTASSHNCAENSSPVSTQKMDQFDVFACEPQQVYLPKPYPREYYVEALQKPDQIFNMACFGPDCSLLGYVVGVYSYPTSDWYQPNESNDEIALLKEHSKELAYVSSLAVKEEKIGHGVGAFLVAQFIGQLRDSKTPPKAIYLHALMKHDLIIEFYRRLGFKIAGTAVGYYTFKGKPYDARILVRVFKKSSKSRLVTIEEAVTSNVAKVSATVEQKSEDQKNG